MRRSGLPDAAANHCRDARPGAILRVSHQSSAVGQLRGNGAASNGASEAPPSIRVKMSSSLNVRTLRIGRTQVWGTPDLRLARVQPF